MINATLIVSIYYSTIQVRPTLSEELNAYIHNHLKYIFLHQH